MSQFAIVFDNDLSKEELQNRLEADGVMGKLAEDLGAYPYVLELAPKPAPGSGCDFCAGTGTLTDGAVTCPDCGPSSASVPSTGS